MSEQSALHPSASLSLSEHLQHVTETLAATTSQEDVLHLVLAPALIAVNAIAGAVLLVDATGQQLQVAATEGHEASAQTIWQDGPLDDNVPAGAALEQHQPLFFEHQDALIQAFPELEERTGARAPVATAVLPMILDSHPLGAIIIDFKEPHTFPPEERRFLQTLAAQCAVAFGRAQSITSLQKQITENEALDSFARLTELSTETIEITTLIRRVTDVLRSTLGDVSVAYYDLEQGLWRVNAWSDDFSSEAVQHMRLGFSPDTPRFAGASRTRQPFFVSSWDVNREGLPGDPQSGSVVIYPLFIADQPVSMLSVGVQNKFQWTDRGQGIIRAIGRSLGLALERSHQTRQLQEEQAASQAFVAFTEAASHATEVNDLANLALGVLQNVLPGCSVAFYEREGERWYARQLTADMSPELQATLRAGLPLETPAFAEMMRIQAPVFINQWNEQDNGIEHTTQYGHAAFYPILQGQKLGAALSVGIQDQTVWSDREHAVVLAVGRSFSLLYDRIAAAQEVQLQRAEAESRARALEGFAELTRDLARQGEASALIHRAQQVVLSLLPAGYSLYFEPDLARSRWVLQAQTGELRSEELQAVADAGLPYEEAGNLLTPYTTLEPYYQDEYASDTDNLDGMVAHLGASATFPVLVQGQPKGILAVILFGTRKPWTGVERAVMETVVRSLGLTLERAQSLAELAERTAELEESNQALQDANEELEAFTYSASHDLRTPVRHVMGFAELAERAIAKGQYEKAGRSLEVVKQGALRMTSLIDGMLILSRSGRQQLQLEPVDLNALVTLARRDAAEEFGNHPVRWQIGDLPTVQGDENLLQQVMTNLLSNAVKYSAKREQSEVSVWSQESDFEWTIRVQDNGVGFDPAYAQKLFGIFQRLHTEKDFKGTGVGLATMRRIVQKHGGQVFAESDGLTGATFGFSLPKEG